MNEDKLNEFLSRFVGDLGATITAGSAVIGHRLGLYRALAEGPATPDELAARTKCEVRYITEWLSGQAAGGYVSFRPGSQTFCLTEEQAFALANPAGPLYAPGGFVSALGALKALDRITDAFRTGAGVGWDEQDDEVSTGADLFFRAGYLANLVPRWIPSLDGVEDRLRAGANVADVGCGFGSSSLLLAEHYPRSRIVGSDYHARSIEEARKRAAEAGVAERLSFEVASAESFSGEGYDLVTSFDCLHDMGDPIGAATHVREALAPDGVWMIVEPIAADDLAGNLNPVGRLYYGFSTFVCVPNAKSQGSTQPLGAQAGEAAIRQIVTASGFSRFRRATETPFNLVYEVRR
jgi:2-polyprenyl-3-methyl-5-hydroxy-6-metoxy-1,4-benzoquinol methylase